VPIVFGPTERSLFGFYHPADPHSAASLAVVLCNPLGYEAMSVHRTYRHLAERLAGRGFPALRFDYDGTGDSSGEARDPGRVRAWLGSIAAALAEVRDRAGVRHLALFGVRFGATLATVAAVEHGEVDCLISWAPVVSGPAHVRDLRAFRMMQAPRASTPRSKEAGEEIGGVFFAPETLADMAAIDLLTLPSRGAARVLVLPRGERHPDETRLVERLKERGADARLTVDSGYGGMMRDDPYETAVPFTTIDTIVEWLGAARYAGERTLARSSATSNVLWLGASGERAGLRETPVQFGDGQRLFGVLTEPVGPIRPSHPVLCFLNVGANHHVGPHRMNVDLGREFALLGYRTFRMDAAGLGDSLAPPGARENQIYTKDAVQDVTGAMTTIGDICGVHRFVLIGLCSGAYLAFHTAVEDARVVGQLLLSPYAFEWKEGDPVSPTVRKGDFHSTRFYWRLLFDSTSWLRLFRGDVNVRAIAGALFERVQTRIDEGIPSVSDLARGRRKPQNEIERSFGALCDRGVETLMVLSFEDSGLDMIARYLGNDARRMRRRRNFSFEIADGADHTFTSIASQEWLRHMLTRYVTSKFP
jgi:pimeloyl-ACP methyl ester carboxylesterase